MAGRCAPDGVAAPTRVGPSDQSLIAIICRCPPLLSPRMSNAASWAVSAANKFRETARTTENPTTKLLAEGLTHLSEAVRELQQEMGSIETKLKALSDE